MRCTCNCRYLHHNPSLSNMKSLDSVVVEYSQCIIYNMLFTCCSEMQIIDFKIKINEKLYIFVLVILLVIGTFYILILAVLSVVFHLIETKNHYFCFCCCKI